MSKKSVVLIVVALSSILILALSYNSLFHSPYKVSSDEPIKIFILNSYRYEQHFTEGQNDGFLESVEKSGLDVETKTFFMNTKLNTSEEWKQKMAKEAIELIDEFDPDLLYITDDNAQKYVGMNYINGKFPIVYSGINGKLEDYGYDKAKNVAGVLETIPYIQSLRFFKEIFPNAEKITVIKADDATGRVVADWMKEEIKGYSDMEIESFHLAESFEDYKNIVMEHQGMVDGFFLDGFAIFKDDEGESLSVEDVSKWTIENSDVPEIVIAHAASEAGALLGVDNAPYEHGKKAWEISREILIDGRDPSDFRSSWGLPGSRFINLKRAEQLGISREDIPSAILVNSDVYESFSWE